MKVTFFSNYLTIHQVPICMKFYQTADIDFCFVATEVMPEWRKKETKYEDLDKKYPFVLATYDSSENEEKAQNLGLESDIVIIGSAPDRYILQRLQSNKVTFRYCERPYKKEISLNNFIRVIGGTWLHHGRFQNKNLYMLCASAYTASDFNKFGCYKGKCYRWGYFPEVKRYNLLDLMTGKKNATFTFLWVGRLIKWKHPEVCIRLAEKLKADKCNFSLEIIGSGDMESELREMIIKKNLTDCVYLTSAMSAEQVRKKMERAKIFLFTSDKNEGWGAVLNEAMNSGCAVIANSSIGSTPFLIKEGKNGYAYADDEKQLYEKVRYLIDNPKEIKRVGEAAYNTIIDEWNAEVAVKRFIELSAEIVNGPYRNYESGPISFINVD